ncbi:MAG: hypothetical protein ACLQVA_15525 [Candidatus Brocadiia bacterium]
MGERQDNQQPQPPSKTADEFRGLVENLAHPVLITDAAGTIHFMNPCAERLLAQGLKERVEAHLKSPARRKLVSQVRFRRDGAGEIVLRLLRSDIEWNWQGRPATLMSLTDVTPGSVAAKRLTQEIAKPGRPEDAPQDRSAELEMQPESPAGESDSISVASSRPFAQEISPHQKSWEEALAQRGQPETPSKEPAAENEGVERPHRAGAEAHAGKSVAEQWASLRQLQGAAEESERQAAAAQKQSREEIQKAYAERHQAQYEAQQLRKQVAEANRQRDKAVRAAEEEEKGAQELEARVHMQADELMKVSEALRQETAECKRVREENDQARRLAAESKAALEESAARCDQFKVWAEQCAAELRQQIAPQQQAQEEIQQLRQKLAKSMASVETFRAGFETLTGQAKASADEAARENEALRRKLAEHEREEESLRTMLKDLSSSGKTFLGAIEKLKAEGQPPRNEMPGTGPAGGENR